MMRALLLLAALALAGCAGERSIAECGLLVHMPARPIDEGVRFDAREVVGDTLDMQGLAYRITNDTAAGREVLFFGDLGGLAASGGNFTLRFLDARDDTLLGVGDALVVRAHGALVLQLSRGANLVGSSLMCER